MKFHKDKIFYYIIPEYEKKTDEKIGELVLAFAERMSKKFLSYVYIKEETAFEFSDNGGMTFRFRFMHKENFKEVPVKQMVTT